MRAQELLVLQQGFSYPLFCSKKVFKIHKIIIQPRLFVILAFTRRSLCGFTVAYDGFAIQAQALLM